MGSQYRLRNGRSVRQAVCREVKQNLARITSPGLESRGKPLAPRREGKKERSAEVLKIGTEAREESMGK